MKDLRGKTAILTGANGGLGRYMAQELAEAGMNLYLVGYPEEGLNELTSEMCKKGVRASSAALDLRRPGSCKLVVESATREFGAVHVLVNNAGVEYTSAYHELTEERIAEVLSVNLEAPMLLTHLLLPHMLQRREGHIVNISSLAGKSGPGYQEPYAATKAGLIAFTVSLRATYRATGVSASVICPGFVEVGIYARLKARTGCSAPPLLGTSPPEPGARAVVRAIQHDLPEVIVNAYPIRPLFDVTALFPAFGEWLVTRLGAHDFFRRVAEAQKRLESASTQTAPRP